MGDTERKATIHFAGNDFFVGVTPSGHAQTIETDSHRGSAATPMELVLLALGGCTGVDVISVLKKKRQHVTDYRIEVHGDRREDFPRAYTRLYVKHIVTGRGVSEQAVAQAIAATGAASLKDMGKVMAALKERHACSMDFGKAGAAVKELLAAK